MKVSREFYLQKKFLEKISNPKYPKKLLHEKFKFLFIGQGQVDTWQPHIGLSEPSKFTNMEFNIKIMISYELQPFHTMTVIFAWSCEINGVVAAVATTTSFWTISHDYVKFSHVHAKST